jgi:oligopeptide/dipeptide ABC transporter ATP-binding protein
MPRNQISETVVSISGLTKVYHTSTGVLGLGKKRRLVALDGVSLSFQEGKTTAIVGESGSGKTTLGECTLMLTRPDSGSIQYNGSDLARLSGGRLNLARRGMQIVFQDPYSSLNPRMKVDMILRESIPDSSSGDLRDRMDDVLRSVGMPSDSLERFPHQFSGGQRQRLAIARALMANPTFMVLDEPTSSLDVSIQLQILNLFRDLQREYDLTFMFITHNLAVAKYMAHHVAVMFSGRFVEYGTAVDVIERTKHPYTAALLSSVPSMGKSESIVLNEKSDSALPVLSGCRYRARCPYATERCLDDPPLADVGNGHLVRCHYSDKMSF